MSPFRGVARILMQRAVALQAAQQTSTTGAYASAIAGSAQQMTVPQLPLATSNSAPQGTTWALQQHPRRGITTSVPNLSKLASILDLEIKHEKDNYSKPDAVASGPPAPFTLSEAPGDTLLTLTRKFNSEDISVDLHVNNQPPPPEDVEGSDEDQLSTVIFNVHVTKGDASLVFECESDGIFVAINHLSHEVEGKAASESTYTGPVFEELDDQLQEELRGYLAERGITPELGEYLRHLVYDKEVREYQSWLQRVADFMKK